MIEIDVGPNLVTLGSFVLSWHGFFSFIAVATAVYLVGRWAPLRGIDPDAIYSIAIWGIVGGIIGARFVHVIDNWTFYSNSPGQILAIYSGGIGLWGGLLGGFIFAAAYALRAHHPVGIIADLTAPALLIVQTIGRLGDIVNGEHCAKATDFFLGFVWTHPDTVVTRPCVAGVAVHPVIAYEMVWNLLALIVVWQLRGKIRPAGMLFALYLTLYSVGRFAISFAREDKVWTQLGAIELQEAHYIALLVLAITVPLLIIKARPATGAEAELSMAPAQAPRPRGTRAQRRRRR